jgi:hypothetical protein
MITPHHVAAALSDPADIDLPVLRRAFAALFAACHYLDGSESVSKFRNWYDMQGTLLNVCHALFDDVACLPARTMDHVERVCTHPHTQFCFAARHYIEAYEKRRAERDAYNAPMLPHWISTGPAEKGREVSVFVIHNDRKCGGVLIRNHPVGTRGTGQDVQSMEFSREAMSGLLSSLATACAAAIKWPAPAPAQNRLDAA